MRAFLAFAMLFALLAAGCTGPVTTTSSTSSATESPPPFDDAIPIKALSPLNLGKGVGEPSIAVGPGNAVYVADPFMTVWRSQDGGRTYTEAASRGMDGGGDGDLAVDGEGTIHWLGLGGQSGPIPYQTSHDGGESFGTAQDLSDGDGFDREWIDARPDGRLYASWRDEDGVVVRTSPDAGATWEEKVVLRRDSLAGPVVHDPASDGIYVPVVADGMVTVFASPDHGATWTDADVASVEPGLINTGTNIFPVVAVDQAGTAYLVYSADSATLPANPSGSGSATRWGIFLSVSNDHGASWSKPRLVSDPAKSAIMPWIAAGAAGRIVVVWYENTVGTASDSMPDAWNVRLWESLDASAANATGQSLLLNEKPVHVGFLCAGGRCTFGSDRSLLDMFEVAINGDGQPVVTWASTTVPFQYPASAVVGGPVAIDIFAGGLETGPRLL